MKLSFTPCPIYRLLTNSFVLKLRSEVGESWPQWFVLHIQPKQSPPASILYCARGRCTWPCMWLHWHIAWQYRKPCGHLNRAPTTSYGAPWSECGRCDSRHLTHQSHLVCDSPLQKTSVRVLKRLPRLLGKVLRGKWQAFSMRMSIRMTTHRGWPFFSGPIQLPSARNKGGLDQNYELLAALPGGNGCRK